MPPTINAPVFGVWSSPNPFSQAPAGSLARAENVRFTAPGVLGPRPGFPELADSDLPSGDSRAGQLALYDGELAAYDSAHGAVDYFDEATNVFVALDGHFTLVGDNRLRFVGAARDLFWNAAEGVYIWSKLTKTVLNYTNQAVPIVAGLVVTGGDSGATARVIANSGVSSDGQLTLMQVTGTFTDTEEITDSGTGVANADGTQYEAIDTETFLAGNPPGLTITVAGATDGEWMDTNTAVAYRYTICSLDAYGRIIEGAPSGRTVYRNSIVSAIGGMTRSGGNLVTVTVNDDNPHGLTSGDSVTLTPGEANFAAGPYVVTVLDDYVFTYPSVGANVSNTVAQTFERTASVQVAMWIPDECTSSNFLRLYRSEMSATADTQPSDDLRLTFETPFLTATNLSNGVVVITDTTPESILEVPLYTNANLGGDGMGLKGANYQPPLCLDMTYFADRMWFLNTTGKQEMQLALIGVGSPDGFQVGDTVTLAGHVFTGVNSTSPGADEFFVYSQGDPATNIRRTALALVQAVNDSSQTDVYAYYTSADSGFPGQMLIQARALGEDSFLALSDRGTAFNPTLPDVTDLYEVRSVNNAHAAGLSYSKIGQPEAVPPINFIPVEADNEAALRCFPLTYRLMIFKTDGIYYINKSEPFSLQKLSEAALIAPDSLALLGEKLYGLFDQGVLEISDAGVRKISEPIEDEIAPLFGTPLAKLRTLTFGVGYETGRQYLLFLPEDSSSTSCEGAWVFSTLSQGWTHYGVDALSGVVDNSTDQLILAPSDGPHLNADPKLFDAREYVDDYYNVTATAVDGDTLTLVSVGAVEVGDVLVAGGGATSLIIEVDPDALTVTTLGDGDFTPGSITAARGFSCDVKLNKLTDGRPAELKMFNQASLLFRTNEAHTTTATFETEVSPAESTVDLTQNGWGGFSFGDEPFGNVAQQIRRVEPLPLADANACQLSVGFQIRQAGANFEFLGAAVQATPDSSVNRG